MRWIHSLTADVNRKSTIAVSLLVMLVLPACGGSGGENQRLNEDEILATALKLSGTIVALTSEAILATSTLVPTNVPSDTQAPTLSPIETEVLFRLIITQTANCRNGPSTDYMIMAQIDEGGSFEIIGRNEKSTWWYIEPLELNEGCWLFGELVTIEGLVEEIPVVESSAIPLIGNDPRFILYFLVAEDTGGTVACGDSLVAMNTGILRTGNAEEDVKIAMRALLSIGSPYVSGLRHSGYQSNLQVVSADYSRGSQVVNVYLSGTVIKPEDNCDKERFRVQIFTTAQQFDNVGKAYVWVGSTPIGDFLVQN
jgi:hypothetical protein